MKWILLISLFFPDGEVNYVVDYDLTGVQCVEMLEQKYQQAESLFNNEDFILSCELDVVE